MSGGVGMRGRTATVSDHALPYGHIQPKVQRPGDGQDCVFSRAMNRHTCTRTAEETQDSVSSSSWCSVECKVYKTCKNRGKQGKDGTTTGFGAHTLYMRSFQTLSGPALHIFTTYISARGSCGVLKRDVGQI